MATLGERIRHRRRQNGFSLRELGERTGIKKEYLCRIETNALPNPTYKTLLIIAQGLGINLVELFEHFPASPPRIRLLPVAELAAEPKPEGWIAIPIIDRQSACQQPLSLSAKMDKGYVLIDPFLIPHTNGVGNYRALCLDKNDHSMSPVIRAGSLICVDFGPHDISQLVGKTVLMRDEEARCRLGHLRIEDGLIVCMPHNIHYTPLIISRQKRDSVLGRVVGCLNCIPST